MTEEEARKELEGTDLGMKVENERQPSNQYEEGEIMSQDPAADTEVAKNSTITVVISSGEEAKMVKVPNIVDRTEEEAEKSLQAAKLTVVHGEAQFSDEIDAGRVISSDPEAGTEVEEGTEVTIVISLGKDQAKVPELRNKSASEAEAALKDAGLAGSASEEYSDSVEAGLVISQSIDAGEKVDKGTTVSYVVSKGPETKYVTVPNLVGKTRSAAEKALRDAGLSVGEVNEDYVRNNDVNLVVDQSISSGMSVEAGTSVSFTVNLGPEPSEPEPEQPSENDGSESTDADPTGSGVTAG